MNEVTVVYVMNCHILCWESEELHEVVRIEGDMSDAHTYCFPC